jgi:hypothetical protein
MLDFGTFQINAFAVLLAAVINIVLSFVWYGGLFAKPWTTAMGYDPNMRPDGQTMAKGMLLMLIGNLLFAWVLAFYLAGWKYIPGMEAMGKFSFGFNSALSVFIGFLMPLHLSKVVWERHSWKLFAINAGYSLLAAIIAGLILAFWK